MNISFDELRKGKPYLLIKIDHSLHKCIDLRKIISIEYDNELMKIITISENANIKINVPRSLFYKFLKYWVQWLNFRDVISIDYNPLQNIMKIVFNNYNIELNVNQDFYHQVLEYWCNNV